MFARQSDFVTSNQNVRPKSANVAPGCSATSHLTFHAYCIAQRAATETASSHTRGRSIDSGPSGADVSSSRANPGSRSTMDR